MGDVALRRHRGHRPSFAEIGDVGVENPAVEHHDRHRLGRDDDLEGLQVKEQVPELRQRAAARTVALARGANVAQIHIEEGLDQLF